MCIYNYVDLMINEFVSVGLVGCMIVCWRFRDDVKCI